MLLNEGIWRADKWRATGEHFKKNTAKAVKVSSAVDLICSFNMFW
jgi:hypothetical protein